PVEVDVLVVGAGPAGLAAAIRLGQVAPELSVAVVEKGKRPGAHLLSGAVLRPGPLRELVGEDVPSYGEVPGDGVYFLPESRWAGARRREFGGSGGCPMGDELVSIGLVVGLDYRDVDLSVHDLLQELKTHPLVLGLLEGGDRVAWGAKTIPEGGFVALPRAFHAPGLLLCGDGVGLVNVPALKGIHYAVESGRLAAEAAARGELDGYDRALRESFVWHELRAVRNMRQAFAGGFWRGS